MTSRPGNGMLNAVLSVTSHLELHEVLRNVVEAAADLTGAPYAAIGVLDAAGEVETHLETGDAPDVRALLTHPHGVEVLEAIGPEPLLLEDLIDHPRFADLPPGHPRTARFLGVQVRVRDHTYGRLYLAGKAEPFTDDDADQVRLLAAAAGIAVQNARLYAAARTRERWLAVGQEITTTLLSGTDIEEALGLIAARVRQVAHADTAVIVLPGLGEDWVIEFADGDPVGDLVGIVMPPTGRAMTVLRDGHGIIVDSFARARNLRVPQFGRYGPSLYAPLMAGENGIGVLILLRRTGAPEFTENELTIAESIARQAALAITLSESRQAQDLAALLSERSRIARDLHDLAIQHLFATGLRLGQAQQRFLEPGGGVEEAVAGDLEAALDGVDSAVGQIRRIVHALRTDAENAPVTERVNREVALARSDLGLAVALSFDEATAAALQAREDLADDVMAVVREGFANAARHARAEHVQVALVADDGQFTITITDDGVGPDPATDRRSGLANLAGRARRHGGRCTLTTVGSGQTGAGGAGRAGGAVLTWTADLP
ncbi:GAF domain-containing sensor histidine kinase [Ruania alba]|uniref:GAF domain-containing protein n=1 Tax=Ruania alba TaxID=648782 RepID=A0A1H5HBN3_9MICO|nr:GAF domain-containing protein [Ruania alba]SEE25379.1 GAF domain-containing protein [Ruania alba]